MEVDADRRRLKHDPRILDQLTLAELVARYRDTISTKKRDAKIEIDRLTRFVALPIAKLSLSAVDANAFAQHRDNRLRAVSASTVNRELAPLQHMYEIARMEWGLPIAENPLTLVRRPRNNPARDRRLRPGEEELLLSAATLSNAGYIRPAIILAIETSMRRSEILRIQREHLSDDQRRLQIPHTKTHRPRTILLSERAKTAVLALHEVFSTARPSRNAFRLCWERTRIRAGIVRAGIEGLHFHDLRHEAISRFFESGMTMPEIVAMSGHADYRMLSRYAHIRFGYAYDASANELLID